MRAGGRGGRPYRRRARRDSERLAQHESPILGTPSLRYFTREKATQSTAPTAMKRGDYIRLSKIGRAPGGTEPCPIQYYDSGIFDGIMSLPIDHVMDGFLLESLRPKGVILLLRVVRNGVVRRGLYRSSTIRRIYDDLIETQNSIWRAVKVPPLRPIEGEHLP